MTRFDGPPIPEMREASLNDTDVRALLADWLACTQIEQISVKDDLRSQNSPSGVGIENAIAELLDQTIAAVQVRYVYEGFRWTDTLIRIGMDIKMVRCRHESPGSPS